MLEESQCKQTMRLTTDAYEKACKQVGYSNVDLRNRLLELEEININEYQVLCDELDEVYRGILCKLPTYVLQNIITAEKEGQQRRAKKTIDTIAIELLERELQRSEKEGDS